MILTKGEEKIELESPVAIHAYKLSGWVEEEVKKEKKTKKSEK